MKERLEIANRIKDLRKANRFSQVYVAEKLFISQAAYSLMESGQNSIASEQLKRLSKLYNVTADFLLTGDQKLVKMTTENGFMPLLNAKAHAGFLKNAHEEKVMEEDFDYYKIPGYNPTKDSVLIEIAGNSMEPTVMSGDVLVCQEQKKPHYVVDGSLVILVTEGELMTTRVFKHEDTNYLKLESDNPEEDRKKEIKKSEVLRVLMVLAKVSHVLVPHKEVAFKGKLQSLEESMEFLNQKVYQIEKMLTSKKQ